jgi:tRNA dimethylallyltransferase
MVGVLNQAMEFLVECRKAGGMTTEKKFLAFLSAFQHVSRCDLKVATSLTLAFGSVDLM